MSLMKIAEVFGYSVDNNSDIAKDQRSLEFCPFKNKACTKTSKENPLGICTLTDGEKATSLCPFRFLQDNKMFLDAAVIAFGKGVRFSPVEEIRILKKNNNNKIGKVDYLLAKLNEDDKPVDFAALEVQSVYFSGRSIRPAMNFFLKKGFLDPDDCKRRPDYRSCAQKRLMPQLRLKVPVFRRWGKKFFVVVDSLFFESLPKFREVKPANSEITWLVYDIVQDDHSYTLSEFTVHYTLWDDILDALREGEAPQPDEIIKELAMKVSNSTVLNT